MEEGFQWRLTDSLHGVRNPGLHWKRRGHRGEEDDTEEDVTKDLDDSSAGASMEEGSMSKNGTYRVRERGGPDFSRVESAVWFKRQLWNQDQDLLR